MPSELREKVLRQSEESFTSHSEDHDFGGLDEGGGSLAGLQIHVARGAGGDDRRDALFADGENDLSHEAADADAGDTAHQLIPAAHAAHYGFAFGDGAGGGAEEKAIHFTLRYPMVSAGSGDAANLLLVDPLFDSWETDAKLECGIAQFQQLPYLVPPRFRFGWLRHRSGIVPPTRGRVNESGPLRVCSTRRDCGSKVD